MPIFSSQMGDVQRDIGIMEMKQASNIESIPCRPSSSDDAVAIIGFSNVFPGKASSPGSFWDLLQRGQSARSEIPENRFNINAFYNSNPNRLDTMNVRGGHFIQKDLAVFDAPFFSIPPSEAASLDPQQRGLLEETHKALENAGIPTEKAAGSNTSVFVGCFAKEYETLFTRDPMQPPKYQATGTGSPMLANRISWFYDLRGPSITLDTACSSSLNALHLACQGLRNHESSMAIVAGCNIILNPDTIMTSLSNLNFLSVDDRCYSFDHRANGYSRGEGFAVVVIKLFSDAIRDKDTIRAVIRATGANQDGKTQGITQPSGSAQQDLIHQTYASSNLDPGVTKFFEAHGTGTAIGDPTEARAISGVFKTHRSPTDPLIIGAVKSNIGHLEGASGLASLIKTVQVLEKGVIPPNIWFEQANPEILVDDWNIKFPVKPMPWPGQGLRRASVNSFGYGGANAHVVLDDALHFMRLRGLRGKHHTVENPPDLLKPAIRTNREAQDALSNGSLPGKTSNQVNEDRVPTILLISSADEAGIERWAERYTEYLSSSSVASQEFRQNQLRNFIFTLNHKRSRLPWKSWAFSESTNEVPKALKSALSKPWRSPKQVLALGFVFTGQGAQWYAMGCELLTFPVYRASIESADRFLRSLGCDWSLLVELLKTKEHTRLHEPCYAQPASTALQIALIDLLASWNVRPQAVVGHSSGEIAAAYCAGGLSNQSAWAVAYFRGLLASRLAKESSPRSGSMMAVALSEEDIIPYLSDVNVKGYITVGCVNSSSNITVSGSVEAVDALKDLLDDQKIFARKLAVNVAYHSKQMDNIASDYLRFLRDFGLECHFSGRGSLPIMYSSVTGQAIPPGDLSHSEYWVSNMTSKVRFSDALAEMCHAYRADPSLKSERGEPPINEIVEIGPRAALRRPVKDTIGDVNYRFALEADQSATRTAMSLAGSLLCQGHDVDLMAVNSLDESKVQMLTDLPAYPFNHSQKYWHESRLSKEFRFRKFPPHELLGTQAIDWNPLMPKWRHFIKASENPWIRDHGFNGATLFPAAGMITMAIEAVRQLSTTAGTMKIANYRLKEVEFSNALVISAADEGVETEFTLRKHKISGNSSGAYEFFLYSRADEKWLKHCQGHIAVEFLQSPTTSVEDRETDETHWIGPKKFETGVNQCHLGVHSKQMYENLKNLGFDMGPAFQTLRDIKYSMEGKATATIGLSDWKSKMPEDARNIQEHVIHPTSLDGIFHLTVVAVTRGGWSPIPTMVPTYLEKLWISNDFLAEKYLKSIKAYSKSISSGYREAQFSMLAVDPDNHKVLVEAENYEATAVSSLHLTSSYESKWKRICYFIDWKPDVDFMHSDSLSSYCELASCHTAPYSGRLVDQAELVSLFYISAVLDETSHRKNPRLEASMDRYVEWMEHQHGSANTQSVLSSLDGQKILKDEDFRNDCIRSLEDSGPEGKLYVTVGQNLSAILHGEVDALDLLFHGSVLQDFYSSSFFTVNYQRMAAYVQLLAHKNPNQRVLEIGAGTGGATSSILQALGPNDPNDNHGTPRYQQYLYTDISAGFFQEAKENFKCHGDRILYKKLDIEKDPAEQGFQIGTYDLIVASCVLHATTSIDKTLQNSRKLLKEGGKLILFEPCNPESARLAFVFGLLPGWWLGAESHRRWSPLLSDELWHNELQKNGFSGNDMRLRDYEGDRHNFSVIASTATSKSQNRDFFNEITLIVSSDSSIQNDIAQEVSRKILSTLGILCKTSSMDELLTGCSEDVFYIFLPEMQHPFLNTISNKNFDKVKAMVNTSVGLLWVAVDGGLSTQRPEMGLTTGFGRSVCSENSNFKFINLSLETIASTAKVTKHILAVLRRAIQDPQMPHESEYLEKDGVLCVNRVVENNFLNDKIHSIVAHQEPQLQEFRASNGREIELTIASPGLLNTLCFIDDTAKSALASEEVEISVQAVGINFKNVMVALGQLPDKSLGQECSGLIIKLGKEVDPRKLNIGDRVCAITHGAFKTTARSHQSSVYKIPDNVSWSTAAALPVAYCTAYYALHYLARLREGESVLIHAAAGGVGQAAVQIAKTKKAKIFATVGSNSKRRLLMDSYNIPESHIFSSRNISFAKGIKEFTGDQGVDIVLNSLTGDILQESFDCIAPLGRFIEIGKRDMYTREKLSMVPFLRNITFSSVDLGIVAERAKSLMAELMTETMNLVWTANLRAPQPVHVFEVSEVEKAFRFLQSGKNAGKTVVELSNHDIVPVVPSAELPWHFDPNATYIVAGGFGGLGRSILKWMARRGAKHLLVFSRSGPKGDLAAQDLKELGDDKVDVVAIPCDIGDEGALITALKNNVKSSLPIKGCIQASMVLRDGLLESMSYENFQSVLRPKVQGSWNLHKHLPKGLDFFVLLSSTGGVFGSRGQSNYATANTYQDSLARYRVSQGEKCISLNLGLMLEVGFAAERQQVMDSLKNAGYEGIQQAELLAMLDHYCEPSLPIPTLVHSQVVTGLSTPASIKRKGATELFWMSRPLFQSLRQVDRNILPSAETDHLTVDYKGLLSEAESLHQAGEIVARALIKKLAMALSMPEADVTIDKSVSDYGVDSLVAVEIRYWFLKEFMVDLAVFNILGSEDILHLGILAAQKSTLLPAALKFDG